MLLSVIQKCYNNEHLSLHDHETILSKHLLVTHEKGAFLLEQGQTLNCYYILLEGVLHGFVHNATGNQITINLYSTADVIIDVNALFQQKKTIENWQCLTDCTLLKINFNDFQELFHNLYGFREWGRTWMANALFELKERSMEMHTLSATERYENSYTKNLI